MAEVIYCGPCEAGYCLIHRTGLDDAPTRDGQEHMSERWIVETTSFRDGEEIASEGEVFKGRPGAPCCILTRSGKHQDSCPRVAAQDPGQEPVLKHALEELLTCGEATWAFTATSHQPELGRALRKARFVLDELNAEGCS